MQNVGFNQDGQGENGAPTANYTLPGVMQYLQSQFTQVERNRLQGELERSSLKLKIIELENERNALLRKNAQLNATVKELKSKLNNFNLGEASHHEEYDDIVESVHASDLSKVIEARKFLKSATNEILYLLKTPTVEFDNLTGLGGFGALSGNDKENDLFYNHPILTTDTLASEKVTDIQKSEFQENVEKHLNDIITGKENTNDVESDAETVIEENIKSENDLSLSNGSGSGSGIGSSDDTGDLNSIDDNGEENDDDDVDDDDDDDFDDDEFDDEDADDIEYLKHPKSNKSHSPQKHKEIEKEKALRLLKRSPRKQPCSSSPVDFTLSIKQEYDPTSIKLMSDFIIAQYEETIAVYGDIFNQGKLIKTINTPDEIKSLKVSENYLAFGSRDLVTAAILNEEDIKITKEVQGFQGLDIEDTRLLVVTDSSIDIFEIGNVLKDIATVSHNIEGDFVATHFVKGVSLFDIAVLTTTNLHLFNMKTASLVKTMPLSHFENYLLTSKLLVLKLWNGYFMLNFDNCTEFKPILFPEEDSYIDNGIYDYSGSDTIFAITRIRQSKSTIDGKIFEAVSSTVVRNIADFPEVENAKHFSLGKTSHGSAIAISQNGSIELRSLTI